MTGYPSNNAFISACRSRRAFILLGGRFLGDLPPIFNGLPYLNGPKPSLVFYRQRVTLEPKPTSKVGFPLPIRFRVDLTPVKD